MKDNFSNQSDKYRTYRPTYPDEVFQLIDSLVTHKGKCWDCGTGNGQIAARLAENFQEVHATDISQNQIDQAPQRTNVHYSIQRAEETNFDDDTFDLITVGQAMHWFHFEAFYNEVRRVAKPGAILFIIGYNLLGIEGEIDPIIREFHDHTIGPYWDPERIYVDEDYRNIPFPFDEIPQSNILKLESWTFERLIGYISTWSAVNHCRQKAGYDPIPALKEKLAKKWEPGSTKETHTPFFFRIGRINK